MLALIGKIRMDMPSFAEAPEFLCLSEHHGLPSCLVLVLIVNFACPSCTRWPQFLFRIYAFHFSHSFRYFFIFHICIYLLTLLRFPFFHRLLRCIDAQKHWASRAEIPSRFFPSVVASALRGALGTAHVSRSDGGLPEDVRAALKGCSEGTA